MADVKRLPAQPISLDVLREKYCKGKEQNPDDIRRRVAAALAAVEKRPREWEQRFFACMQKGFMPAGRIMSAAGTDIQATLINCFVQPIADTIRGHEDGAPGIYPALEEAAETMRRGGGVGYNFSRLRPSGAFVEKTHSRASGPVSYMTVFDSSCSTVESAGARRGAQMGMLNCDHPDVLGFIECKDDQQVGRNFNLSVAVTDAFLEAVDNGSDWELVHEAKPDTTQFPDAYQRGDGLWVYEVVEARELWDSMIHHTYEHGDPGIFYVDRVNAENNLYYCEHIDCTNPCAEQALPPYGCCCLGSQDLTQFVRHPFTDKAEFDFEAFEENVKVATRMLDNVLDVTYWPLEQQKREAMAKRRVGQGFTGLGTTLVMLRRRYDSEAGRVTAQRIAETMRDAAYEASAELASEKGAFPLFDARKYLKSGFAKNLHADTKNLIRKHGLRNSHLLSIAPTGTITIAFADNASSGIEPSFSWGFNRKVKQADGTSRNYPVIDHGLRLYARHLGFEGDDAELLDEQGRPTIELPEYFVTALEMKVDDHLGMMAAVQPYIDSSISKTVNIPTDYDFEDFKEVYRKGWRLGLKCVATFRDNRNTGSVLSTGNDDGPSVDIFQQDEADRRIELKEVPKPPLQSLRWPKRPDFPAGNPAWEYMLRGEWDERFALFIGHTENGTRHAFEAWVNGAEQPRGLGALAKSISMDMRANDMGWLTAKLDSLAKVQGERPVEMTTPDGTEHRFPGVIATFAYYLRHRLEELGGLEAGETPVLDALMSRKEPKTGAEGTMGRAYDIKNPATGDDFVLFTKELVMPGGERRPYSFWLSGSYPRTLDGLCKSLSFDARVVDPAWIGKKLRQLADFPEPQGDFLAQRPGSEKQKNYPSTIAYIATLLLYRYQQLGILDADGYPTERMGVIDHDEAYAPRVIEGGGTGEDNASPLRSVGAAQVRGNQCPDCYTLSLIEYDGCERCTSCGYVGNCG